METCGLWMHLRLDKHLGQVQTARCHLPGNILSTLFHTLSQDLKSAKSSVEPSVFRIRFFPESGSVPESGQNQFFEST